MANDTSQLNVVIRGKDELTPQFNQLESRLIRFVGAVTSAIAALKISTLPITSAADLERELANVKKTTGFTTTEITKLNRELLEMSLRIDVSALDLGKIAAAAGQQGLGGEGVEGILRFTESVARMASVLDISADQAASDIGKILNIFQLGTDQVENVVAAFNKVTNNAPAQGRQVLDIVKRIGSAASVSKDQVGGLTNAIALAATGLELGINPEVIGTSFTKIFAQMQTKAEKFGQVLGKAGKLGADPSKWTEDWSKIVAKDGLEALRVFNEVLRKMDRVPQAKTISELQGQGRVYGLGSKLGSDTLDASLNKNLDNARSGFAKGLSAIEEQRTVLNTLNAQLQILKNSFFKLAAEGGSPLLGKLAAQARQVTDALQSDKLQAFVQAATAAIGDLISVVIRVGGAIGEMNINWENFVQVLKVFVTVKVVQYFAAMAAGMLATANAARGSFLSIITGFRASTDAATRAALASGDASRIAAAQRLQAAEREKGSLAGLQKAYRDKQAAAAAASAAQLKATQAEFAANNAVARQLQAQRAERAANALVGTTGRAAAVATARVNTAVSNQAATTAAGLASVAAARQVGNAKIAAAEAAHQRQLTATNDFYRGARTAADKAARDQAILLENNFYARQLAALKAADTRRIAEAEATALRLNQIAAQRVIGANTNLSNVVNRAGTGSAAAAGAAAAAASTTAVATRQSRLLAVEAGRARQAAEAARVASLSASAGLFSLSRGLALVASGFGLLLRSIFPVFLILTILYTVLDATGTLQPVLGFFRGLTDIMGLTSEASRQLARDEKLKQEAIQLSTEKVQEQIDAFRELLDLQGRIDPTKLNVDVQTGALTASIDVEARAKILGNIGGQAVAGQALQNQIDQNLKTLPEAKKKAKETFDSILKEYQKLQKDIKDLKLLPKDFGNDPFADDAVGRASTGRNVEKELADAEAQFAKFGKELVAANNAVKTLTQSGVDGLSTQALSAASNMTQLNKQITSLFSEDSKKLFQEGVPLREKQEELKSLKDEYAKLLGAPLLDKKPEERAAALEVIGAKIRIAETEVGKLVIGFDQLKAVLQDIARQEPVKAYTDSLLGDLARAEELLGGSKKTFDNFNTVLKNFDAQAKAGVTLPAFVGGQGGNAKPAPPSTGTNKSGLEDEGKNKAKAAENEAKKLAKAKQELRRAELEQDAAIQKEGSDQFLRQQQREFDAGLLALEDYYDDKDAVERSGLATEIKLQADKIASKQVERGEKGLKESDRVKIDAEIVGLETQRQLLVSRLADIPAQTKVALDKAVKDFNEGVLGDKLDLARSIGLSDASATFSDQLALVQSQIKDRLARFNTELKKGTPGITQTFIDNFKVAQLLKIIDPALQLIAEKAKIAAASVQTSFNRIEAASKRGLLTDREAERAKNEARKVEAKAVALQISQSEQLLEQAIATTAAQTGQTEASVRASDEYTRQAQTVDDLRVKYEELNVVVDEVATSLNQSIESGLSDSLTAIMTGTTGGLKNLLKTFAADFTKTINDIVSKELSQQFVKKFLGGGGTGGIGGFFSNLFGINSKAPALADKESLGRSESTPMFVKEVGKKPGDKPETPGDKDSPFAKDGDEPSLSDVLGTKDAPFPELEELPDVSEIKASDFSEFASEAEEVVGTGIDAVKDGIFDGFGDIAADAEGGGLGLGGFFSSMGGALSGIFESLSGGIGGMADGLTSVLGSLFNSLVSAFSGGAGAAGGAGGGTDWGSIIGTIVSFFHTGGVVGEGAAMAAVNPMVFANATRYHSGGIAGLQANEVPAILQKGEEVLTADSPRHRNNGGGGNTVNAPVTMIIQTPDANSFRKSQDQIASSTGRVVSRAVKRNN